MDWLYMKVSKGSSQGYKNYEIMIKDNNYSTNVRNSKTENTIYSEEIVFSDSNKVIEDNYTYEMRPEIKYIIKTYYQSGKPDINNKVVIYFHGGPGETSCYENTKALTDLLVDKNNFIFCTLEIAGSSSVDEWINDVIDPPNYVTQISEIVDYLKNSQQFQNKEFIAIGHSYGCYQLLNYLRYTGEHSGFVKAICSSGVYNTGAWSFQVSSRFYLQDDPYNEEKVFKIFSENNILTRGFFSGTEQEAEGFESKLHSIKNMFKDNNPLKNMELNKQLNPYFHVDELPKIPYLIQAVTNDRNVHASQSIEFYKLLLKNNYIADLLLSEGGQHSLNAPHDLVKYTSPELKNQEAFLKKIKEFLSDSVLNLESVNQLDSIINTLSFHERTHLSDTYTLPYVNWNEAHVKYCDTLAGNTNLYDNHIVI